MKLNTGYARTCTLTVLFVLIWVMSLTARIPVSSSSPQDLIPAGELRELAIDDGDANCVLGFPVDNTEQSGRSGFGWANKLTPASYPATLRSITIGFNRTNVIGNEVRPDALYRIVVFTDPEMDGPGNGQAPAAAFSGRVRGIDTFMTFNLITPITITQGSFVVGAIDEIGAAGFPALFDVPGKSTPPGSESFLTTNSGISWRPLSETQIPGSGPCNAPGSWLIRATVEIGSADAFAESSVIKDPLAVEPWAVAAGSSEVFVTNYVSDNVTIIKVADNSFNNVTVGDGPGGTPDGPFGVAINPDNSKAFVTLFGSNTIPSKEFPVDYSTVGPGRVAVLTRQTNGTYTQTVLIAVGKGPKFPALVSGPTGLKLYVPCGGANRVDVIDVQRNEKIREIPVGNDPSSCTAAIRGPKLYVTNFGDGTISVIDTRTDTKIKDIPAPHITQPELANPPVATNPWNGAISQGNGNLYVTYWGTQGDVAPNGAIVEIDTCSDEVLRAIIDPSTVGTPAGSAGASGIAAPNAPLTRSAETGTTTGAGGGGGGPFGITACRFRPAMVFTNDGLGIVGVIDSRIDQVVSAPPLAIATCPKPRGVACIADQGVPPTFPPARHIAYVACGQPDSSVHVLRVPALRENIAGLPVIQQVDGGNKLVVKGLGFTNDTRVEVIDPVSGACLTFEREPKIRKGGTEILQKGKLSDGRKLKDVVPRGATLFLRITDGHGTVRLFFPPPVTAA